MIKRMEKCSFAMLIKESWSIYTNFGKNKFRKRK
jgi:hypothetical protein